MYWISLRFWIKAACCCLNNQADFVILHLLPQRVRYDWLVVSRCGTFNAHMPESTRSTRLAFRQHAPNKPHTIFVGSHRFRTQYLIWVALLLSLTSINVV
jgi:hypothetical protein